MKKLIILLITFLLLTGCYDYHELNNINIVNSILIDYSNNEYNVYLEIIKSSKEKDNNEFQTSIINGKDKNIAKAFNNAIQKSNKEIYLKQSRLLILSEELARSGITDITTYLLNDITLSNNYFLVITNNIEELLSTENASNTIIDTLKNINNYKKIDDIEKITGDLLNKQKDIVLPYIDISNNNIDISQIGYFKEDKLINTINNKIYNFLIKDNNTTEFSFNNNTITIYKKKIKYDTSKDKITINIIGYGYANLINNEYDLKDNNSYRIIETQLNKQIKQEITKFINTTLNNNSDLISLKDLYYKKYNKEINTINYDLNIDIKIDKNGSLYEGLYD